MAVKKSAKKDPMVQMFKDKDCPRCGNKEMEYPAISRRDNETEICSACGTEEAMVDMARSGFPQPFQQELSFCIALIRKYQNSRKLIS